MRERTYRVDTDRLRALSAAHGPDVAIARRLGISRQRWYTYKSGMADVPETFVDLICAEFNLERQKLVVA